MFFSGTFFFDFNFLAIYKFFCFSFLLLVGILIIKQKWRTLQLKILSRLYIHTYKNGIYFENTVTKKNERFKIIEKILLNVYLGRGMCIYIAKEEHSQKRIGEF